MTPSEFISGMFVNLVSSIVYELGKKSFEASLFPRVISATAADFPDLSEGVEYSLSTWLKSNQFKEIVENTFGIQDLTGDSYVLPFIEIGGFSIDGKDQTSKETYDKAHEVLISFGKHLKDAFLLSGMAIPTLAAHIDNAQARTTTEIKDSLFSTEFQDFFQEQIAKGIQQAQIVTILDIENEPLVIEKTYNAKIEEARKLIDFGKFQSAILILEGIRKELDVTTSGEIKFKIATNIGVCKLNLDDFDTARVEFEVALGYKPNSPKALANLSQLHLLKGESKKAEELIRNALNQLTEKDPNIHSMYLHVLCDAKLYKELDHVIENEKWLSDDPIGCFHIGVIRCEQQQFSLAEAVLKRSLELDGTNPYAHAMLGVAITDPIRLSYAKSMPLTWLLDNDDKNKLLEGIDELGVAINQIRFSDCPSRRHSYLIQRSIIYGLLGEEQKAQADCAEILKENPQYDSALFYYGSSLIETSDYEQAISQFNQISNPEIRSTAMLSLALAYNLSGNPDKTINILLPLSDLSIKDDHQLLVADVLMSAYHNNHDTNSIIRIIEEIQSTWGNNPEALTIIGRQWGREGKTDQAIDYFKDAIKNTKGHERNQIHLLLADLCYSQRKYKEAIANYKLVINMNVCNPPLTKYITSLYNLGDYKQAYKLSRKLRNKGNPIPVITDVEIAILDYIGDLKQARSLHIKFDEVYKNQFEHRIRVALIDFWMGDYDSAKEIVQSVSLTNIVDDYGLLMVIAELRSFIGLPHALDFAYKARQVGFDDPRIHLSYMRLIHAGGDDDKNLHPDKIGVNCVIKIRWREEIRTVKILDTANVNKEADEYKPTDSVGMMLLHKLKGDVIQIQNHEYEIIDIQSKYIIAFQQSLQKYHWYFPDDNSLEQIEISDDDISPILQRIDARHEWVNEALRLYEEKGLTLGILAQMLGVSVFDTWLGIISWTEGHVITTSGALEDIESGKQIISQANGIVLDLTSLFTIHHLGVEDRLTRRFERLIVPQAVLDAINEMMIKYQSESGERKILSKEGNGYVLYDIRPEEEEFRKDFIKRIQNFILSQTEVVPVLSILDMGKEEFEKWSSVLGKDAIVSVLAAKEYKSPLYTDENSLRLYAKDQYKVDGIWTQSVLRNLLDTEKITDEEYRLSINKLIMSNYRFISIDEFDLLWALKGNNYVITKEVNRVFSLLWGPTCSETSARIVISRFIMLIMQEPLNISQRNDVLDIVISSLSMCRDKNKELRILNGLLLLYYKQLPIQRQPLKQIIFYIHDHYK